MSRVIVFDVNETLLDLDVLRPHFQRVFSDARVMENWFALLLHSSLVTTLTTAYTDFGLLAGAALELVASRQRLSLADRDRDEILTTVRQLPPHPEVLESLARMRSTGLRMATLTNSSKQMLTAQMENSGLRDYFDILLSVDEVQRFKPAPETYQMAAKKLGVKTSAIRMVAAHDWDVFGALRAGCDGAFIARNGKAYHPLYEKPDVTGPDLRSVTEQIFRNDL